MRCRRRLFPFISAKAMATLEFLQGEWINNGNFAGVGDERDPMVGLAAGRSHLFDSAGPVRRRIHGIETSTFFAEGIIVHAEPVGIGRWIAELFESSQAALAH